MFFNRSDINWFKPVELRTKYGRRGHIREPLGTHGHFKALFDKSVSQQVKLFPILYIGLKLWNVALNLLQFETVSSRQNLYLPLRNL
jgi:hypothetical protein